MRSRGDDFKPIQSELRLTAKAARDYTKGPEVTAAPPARQRFEFVGRLRNARETRLNASRWEPLSRLPPRLTSRDLLL
jgi:hypothetical protein